MADPDFEAELEEMLADAESTVRELRVELAELRAETAREDRTAAQHAEIERLEQHLEQTKVDWAKVREFLVDAVREIREKKGRKP